MEHAVARTFFCRTIPSSTFEFEVYEVNKNVGSHFGFKSFVKLTMKTIAALACLTTASAFVAPGAKPAFSR